MTLAVPARLRSLIGSLVNRAKAALRNLIRPAPSAHGLVADLRRTQPELVAENMLLRQQIIVLKRHAPKRPRLHRWDRLAILTATRFTTAWRDAILIVKPDTVLRWHRKGFWLFWKLKSRTRKLGRPPIAKDIIHLIQRMDRENRTWGAERLRGELLKLGIDVAKATIQKYMKSSPSVSPRGQSWHTFLRNHHVWACDFLQLHDIWFCPIFAFFIVDINSKQVIHVGVTRSPSATWTAQQLRDVTPFDQGPLFIIRDRDSKFGPEFDRVASGANIQVIKTAVKAPLMNSVCERFLGTVRREALDHVIIMSEQHLRRVLAEYVAFFNAARPHQGLGQRIPIPTLRSASGTPNNLVGIPVLSGLHHDYRMAA